MSRRRQELSQRQASYSIGSCFTLSGYFGCGTEEPKSDSGRLKRGNGSLVIKQDDEMREYVDV